jgi:hypothetical protein
MLSKSLGPILAINGIACFGASIAFGFCGRPWLMSSTLIVAIGWIAVACYASERRKP